jgi:predicted DNA-binding transcriptional regulator AlpA
MTDRLIRLPEIIGDKKTGEKGILSIGATSFWRGVRTGRYPQPVRLGKRTTCWKLSEIMAIVNAGIDSK